MAGVNKVILIGNLGKDPEIRHLPSGSMVANFSLATTESYTDKDGTRKDMTEWHDLEMWDGLAKIAEKYLTKGKSIYVEGRIKTETYPDKENPNFTHRRTKIRVNSMTMLGSPTAPGQSQTMPRTAENEVSPIVAPTAVTMQPPVMPPMSDATVEDDLPF